MPKQTKSFVGLYILNVRKRRSKVDEPLGSFNDTDSLLREFLSYSQSLVEHHQNGMSGLESWQMKEIHRYGNIVAGLVEVGENGYTSRIIDRNSGRGKLDRGVDDSEMVKTFFALDAPPEATTAILVLQKHGMRSPHSFFAKAFREYFQNKFPDFLLHLSGYVSQSMLRLLKNGKLHEVSLSTFVQSNDYADRGRLQIPRNIPLTLETKVKLPDDIGLPGWVVNGIVKSALGRVINKPVDADRIDVTITHGGIRRTVQIGKAEHLVPYFDATDELTIRDGHPTYASIKDYAFALLDDVAVEIRGDN